MDRTSNACGRAQVAAASAAEPVVCRAKRGGGRRRSGQSERAQLLKVIEPHDSAGADYPLAAEMTIGRAPGCVVVVDDTYVSQLHARVFADGETYRLEDLGSTNGTFLNGNGVSAPQALSLGDRIRVGNMVWKSHDDRGRPLQLGRPLRRWPRP